MAFYEVFCHQNDSKWLVLFSVWCASVEGNKQGNADSRILFFFPPHVNTMSMSHVHVLTCIIFTGTSGLVFLEQNHTEDLPSDIPRPGCSCLDFLPKFWSYCVSVKRLTLLRHTQCHSASSCLFCVCVCVCDSDCCARALCPSLHLLKPPRLDQGHSSSLLY